MLGWRWIVACLLASGCIQAQLQPCGDLLCPVDSVCLPDNTCATHESIEVCMGKVDGDTCSTALFTGSCKSGVCRPPVCGDHIVSGSEQCDGPVSGVDCVDYGFDTGIPTCSDRCGFDVVGSCVRFGWQRILSQAASRGRVDDGRMLLVSQDRYTVTLLDGTTVLQEQSFDPNNSDNYIESIDLKGNIAVASQYGKILRSDNGGPFVAESPPGLSDTNLNVVLGDDGSVYAISFSGGLGVFRKAPGSSTWTMVIDGVRNASLVTWLGDALYVAWDDGEVQKWQPGGVFTHVMTAPSLVSWIALRPGGGYFITTDVDNSLEVVGTTFTPFANAQGYDQIFAVGTAIYAGGDSNAVVRRVGTSFESMIAPIYGNLMVDGNDVYIFGNGVYKFSGTQFARRDGSGEPAHDVKLLADGEPIMSTIFDALVIDGMLEWDFILSPEEPLAVAGANANDFYVAEVDDIEHFAGTTAGFSTTNPPSSLSPLDIAYTSGTLYAVGKAGVSARRTGTTWTLLTNVDSTCNIFELATPSSGIYAAGTCGTDGVIWKLAGSTWSEIHRVPVPLGSISIDATDNIYATGRLGSITRVDGMWNDAAGPGGSSISATQASDIWVAGGPDDLVRWDGTIWSRVRLVGAANPQVLATERAIYINGASDSVLLR
ncbi:MAG TPA: hypothetical protein VL326_00105 [Kofleriaceae bacterium]|nr:hypothetical protein [Kofleriaceae bacterium]